MKFLILILCSIFTLSAYSQHFNKQNSYIDALELARIFRQNTKLKDSNNQNLINAYYTILEKYDIDSQSIYSNPFLSKLIIRYNLLAYNPNSNGLKKSNQKNKNVLINTYKENTKSKIADYSAGNLEVKSIEQAVSWEASAINGVSNFMASRFKQEILHIGINQMFSKIIDSRDSNLCKYLFPKSYEYVLSLYAGGGQSYYSSDLMILRHAALMDMENLPVNLVKNASRIIAKTDNQKKSIDVLLLSQKFIHKAQNGYALDKLITSLAKETYSTDSNIYRILHLIDLVSQASLNTRNGSDYWVSALLHRSSQNIELEKIELRMFYALLYQQLMQIPEFKNYIEVTEQNSLPQTMLKLQKIVTIIENLNIIHEYLANQQYKIQSVKDFNNYLSLYLNTLGNFNQILLEIGDSTIANKFTIHPRNLELCSKYFLLADAINAQEYDKIIPIFISEFRPYLSQNIDNLRTLSFISQLSTIRSDKDMENLLKSSALPIGGASIKRNSQLNISFNGYVGMTGGSELALASHHIQTKPNLGLAAPIGVSITGSKQWTYFCSIIDLGSIVNQRFGNDTSAYSNLKLEHFFAPGLGLYYNVKKLPISFGFHGNYIPNLRTIKYENQLASISETNVSVIRFNLSILIDIPFLTLYNQGLKKRRN